MWSVSLVGTVKARRIEGIDDATFSGVAGAVVLAIAWFLG